MEEGPKNPWKLAGALTAVFCFTLVGGLAFIVMSFQPQPIKPVTGFAKFTTKDQAFSCVYPQGWKTRSFGSGGVLSGGEFKQGSASISVTSDLAGSLVADISKATGGMMTDIGGAPGMGGMMSAAQKPPIEKLHEASLAKFEKEFKEYSEEEAKPFQTPFGEGRYSEFSYDGMFGGSFRGYRATLLGGERRIEAVCTAPEKNWDTMKTHYAKVISSISPGTGG
jgi:hypothetical protein